jgi:transcription antitermination factor NusG
MSDFNKEQQQEVPSGWYLALEFIQRKAEEERSSEDIIDYLIPSIDKKDRKNNDMSVMLGYFTLNLRLTPRLLKTIEAVQNAKVHLASKKVSKNGKISRSRSAVNHKITFDISKKMTVDDLEKISRSSQIYNEMKNVYNVGERVVITDGAFKGCYCILKKISENDKMHLEIDIIGRRISIELDKSKIKKED